MRSVPDHSVEVSEGECGDGTGARHLSCGRPVSLGALP